MSAGAPGTAALYCHNRYNSGLPTASEFRMVSSRVQFRTPRCPRSAFQIRQLTADVDSAVGTVGAGRAIPSDVCDQLKCVDLKCSCVSVWWQMYINWPPLSLQTEHLIIGDRCRATDAVGGEGPALLIGPRYLLSRKFSLVIRNLPLPVKIKVVVMSQKQYMCYLS